MKGPCGSGFRVGDIRMNSCIYKTDTELHSDIVTGKCVYTGQYTHVYFLHLSAERAQNH